MTKNNIKQTSSNDEEFLDSNTESNIDNINNTESINSENEQKNTQTPTKEEKDVSLDNSTITTSNETSTSSKSTSTQKYLVVLSTPTKIVIDIDGNGASYSPTQFTKTLTIGDEIEIPPSEEGE